MPKTKLSWPDYKQAALKLKSQGLGFPKIYDRLGVPTWNGVEYKLESDKGSIKRKSREASRAGKASSTRRRNTNLSISTPKGADTRAANYLVKQINAAGGQADHMAEVSRTANAMRDMSPPRRRVMQQRMVTGHQEANLQYLTPEDNLQKNIDYRRLDSHLRKLSKKPVVGNPNFRGLMIRTQALSAVIPDTLEFIPIIDEMVGNPITRTVGQGVNALRTSLGFEPKPLPSSEPYPVVKSAVQALDRLFDQDPVRMSALGIAPVKP